MSDLDEPPAKVLKIDTIDGVTHVTELTEYPTPFDGGEMMEESGIIEGGADVPEEQEQWLSEGILTDEDYIPGSQDTAGDRTDSQLGSTHEEEHLDSTLDSEALVENEQSLEQTEQHLVETQQNVVSNGHNLEENEPNLTENHQEFNSKHLTESDQQLQNSEVENEQNIATNEEQLVINEQSLVENEQSLVENEQSLVESEHYENEEHLADTSLESETAHVENEQTQMQVDTTPSLEDSQEDIQNTASNSTEQANLNAVSEPQTIEKLMEMSNLGTNFESQTYTQESEETLDIVQASIKTEVKEETKPVEINIEETMKNLDGETDGKTDDFDSLLKWNTDIKKEPKRKIDAKEDDGNDTDDLLRMLGEDDNKSKKKLTKTVADIRKSAQAGDSTDDDEFVYENTRIKKIKAAQSVLKKKIATKAVPEDMDDVVQPAPKPVRNMSFKSGASILRHNRNKPAVHLVERPRTEKPRQYHNKRMGQSLLKPTSTAINAGPATTAPTSLSNQPRMPFKPAQAKTSTPFKPSFAPKSVENKGYGQARIKIESDKVKTEPKILNFEVKKPPSARIRYEPAKIRTEMGMIQIEPGRMRVLAEDTMQEEQFLEEEEFPLDEDEFAESENDISHRQRILRPEIMDEEIPSDGESGDEDASLYDEMPTSDSDDADDWFQLDLRCEKAGEYLPLLGPRAKELLLEEKRRVAARLTTLSQSHKALAASGKQQAGLLRRATAALAEIDDMIRAA